MLVAGSHLGLNGVNESGSDDYDNDVQRQLVLVQVVVLLLLMMMMCGGIELSSLNTK